MATIHASPPNMVPTIPSGTLPQTPSSEWAENMTDLLGNHVTRTPVGTPGPDIPGGFPAHLEPDDDAVNATSSDDASRNAESKPSQEDGGIIATAQATLAAATAYLPPGLAAYLPAASSESTLSSTLGVPPSASESSLPALPPSSSSLSTLGRQDGVDVGHATNIPYTESAPEPYRAASNAHSATPPNDRLDSSATTDSTALSTTVHTGHASSLSGVAPVSPPVSVSSPASTSTPRPTSGLIPSHPGVASPSPPAVPKPTSGLIPSHPGVAATPPLTESPVPLSSPDAPQPTPGLVPSHPGVSSPSAAPAPHVTALPTHRAHFPHPTPTPPAAPAASVDASMPSLASTGGDSGYAASTETESLATPGSVSAPASWPTPPAYVGGGADETRLEPLRAGDVHTGVGADAVPTGDFAAPSGDDSTYHPRVPGSAAATSSAPRPPAPPADPQSQYADDEGANSSGSADEVGEEGEDEQVEGEGQQKPKKSKKPKLIQRLKEKMHVGSGSA
ncbi:hypothetical protein DFH08DRAFT_1075472 [Mycena albidolilacea]|uniref:Uncharacterized protein n=1 Tax=Mycena albidolilacea TaxID=1033008 RepID=A0AAD7EYM7_9AGAR|nr:hypothetical protein DFH08DRAFT_1075472 [Mycena albidolilacea]